MTYQKLTEAIAAKISALWPERMLYRDFCPVDHKRPSSFLYVTDASYMDGNIALVEWNYEAELTLYAATDHYAAESTQALRLDQLAVLNAFAVPTLKVGDRTVAVQAAAEAPGPGEAYVRFSAQWVDSRPGYVDENTAPESGGGVPRMENYTLKVGGTPPADKGKD